MVRVVDSHPRAQVGADVSVRGLVRRYGIAEREVRALRGIDLAVRGGEAVALMGPSGSGKSTLLHLIGAMDKPDESEILVGTHRVDRLRGGDAATYRRQVGFVFQRFHLLPALSAIDNVIAPLLPFATPFDKREQAHELLARVGLWSRERAFPSELSGGEQQRVAIARALVNNPALVLADEPTGNLDSVTGADVLDLLLELKGEHGMTVIIATHDPSVASRCDRLVRLLDGRIKDEMSFDVVPDPGEMLQRISRLDPAN